MHRALAGTGTALTLTLALSACSSAPEVAGVDSDELISTCLDGAKSVAEEDDLTVEGTVSSVTTSEDDEGGSKVHIIFDAREQNGTADARQCDLSVGDGEVQEFRIKPPESELPAAVEDASDRWNDKHAEDWADGGGPEPVAAPSPETGPRSYYE